MLYAAEIVQNIRLRLLSYTFFILEKFRLSDVTFNYSKKLKIVSFSKDSAVWIPGTFPDL